MRGRGGREGGGRGEEEGRGEDEGERREEEERKRERGRRKRGRGKERGERGKRKRGTGRKEGGRRKRGRGKEEERKREEEERRKREGGRGKEQKERGRKREEEGRKREGGRRKMTLSFFLSLSPGTRDPGKSWNEAMPACMMKTVSKRRAWCSQQPDVGAKKMCLPCLGLCRLASLRQVVVSSKPSKLRPRKGVDRSMEIQKMEATRMYEKLIHKARAIKLGAACIMLAEWPGVSGARSGVEGNRTFQHLSTGGM